jgi:hypothetical protein
MVKTNGLGKHLYRMQAYSRAAWLTNATVLIVLQLHQAASCRKER